MICENCFYYKYKTHTEFQNEVINMNHYFFYCKYKKRTLLFRKVKYLYQKNLSDVFTYVYPDEREIVLLKDVILEHYRMKVMLRHSHHYYYIGDNVYSCDNFESKWDHINEEIENLLKNFRNKKREIKLFMDLIPKFNLTDQQILML